LIHRITPSSFSSILDFAREHDISPLRDWCMKLFPKRFNVGSMTQVIKYLHDEENSEYKEENDWIKKTVVDFVIENFSPILEKSNTKEILKLYADFLRPLISSKKIIKFTELFKGKIFGGEPPSFILSDEMTHLRHALFNCILIILEGYPNLRRHLNANFYSEFSKYITKKIEEHKSSILKQGEIVQDGKISIEPKVELVNESDDGTKRKAIKRMEPSNCALEEEERNGPTLKKTKQSVAA